MPLGVSDLVKHSYVSPSPWIDRFNRPTVDRLVAELPAANIQLFKLSRRMLHDAGLRFESVAWHGECWKWTIEFRPFASAEMGAVIVPAPENLQLALPVAREFVDSLPMRRLKKAVREGLELASHPFDTRLAIWSISTSSLLGDLQDLLNRQARHLARKTG